MSSPQLSYERAVENANQAYKAGDRRAAHKWAGIAEMPRKAIASMSAR